jgi:GNAT superfamily N-acetyltransferase
VARIWTAGEDDVPAVAGLLAEFRDWWKRSIPDDDTIERGVRRLLEDPGTEFLLGAGSGAPEAVAQLRFRHSIWTDAEDCELEDLFVRRAARRSGLGRALAEASIERARERGCLRIVLDANDANPPAMALYESLGFSAFFDPPGGSNLNLRKAL